MTKHQQSLNHPQKGSRITVDPIRSLEDINEIKLLLRNDPLYLCLFTLGINTGLRASDLLHITAGQVKDLSPMDELCLNKRKTGNGRRMNLNSACVDAIHSLLASRGDLDEEVLFIGQRGPLTVSSVNRLWKRWARQCGIRGNFGSHSARKTFGYHQRATFGVCLPELMRVFGHSSERQTLAYIGIQDETIKNIYANTL